MLVPLHGSALAVPLASVAYSPDTVNSGPSAWSERDALDHAAQHWPQVVQMETVVY